MKIFIMGAGRMGAWLVEELCFDHEIAVYDPDRRKLKYLFDANRLRKLEEVEAFRPELVINAVSLPRTQRAFLDVLPYLPSGCMLSDIASVKAGCCEFYKKSGRRFVSTHPMFGPTFANIRDLRDENAIIIRESDEEGKAFFRNLYENLHVSIYEYTFEEHDETIAYSLSVPFASSMVFAASIRKQQAPGNTFKKHMAAARGLLSQDDHLLAEVMFNTHTLRQIERMNSHLAYLAHVISARDQEEMQKFLNRIRNNIE